MSPIRVALPVLLMAVAPAVADPKPQVRVVPLKEIYTNYDFPEGAHKVVHEGMVADEKGREIPAKQEKKSLSTLITEWHRSGPDLYLVDGKTIAEAIWLTHLATRSGESDKRSPTYPPADVPGGQLWLFVHIATDTKVWVIRSVRIEGSAIRFTCRHRHANEIGPDELADTGQGGFPPQTYLAWVPLPQLKPAKYTLELYDEDDKDVVMTRRVTVSKE